MIAAYAPESPPLPAAAPSTVQIFVMIAAPPVATSHPRTQP